LILTNRSLERLPGCLARTLRSLDGSHNLLRALSVSELGRLTELQVLTLRHNRIATLRWGRRMPAGLHTLDLSYNLLAALPPCAGPALRSLRALVLAGNPLQVLQPRAFACFPALQLLNLSSSALGHSAQGGISEQAFTGAGGEPLATLEVLDLSGTYLERGESELSAVLSAEPFRGEDCDFPGVQQQQKEHQRHFLVHGPCSKRHAGFNLLCPERCELSQCPLYTRGNQGTERWNHLTEVSPVIKCLVTLNPNLAILQPELKTLATVFCCFPAWLDKSL
jgi:hypothetical protein